jgi:hypothetical protein
MSRNLVLIGTAQPLLQANELVCIRTLLHLKVFEHLPAAGSITLTALANATGVQASLLGTDLTCPTICR